MRGKKESDHNSIMVKLSLERCVNYTAPKKISWNLNTRSIIKNARMIMSDMSAYLSTKYNKAVMLSIGKTILIMSG